MSSNDYAFVCIGISLRIVGFAGVADRGFYSYLYSYYIDFTFTRRGRKG
jgi:hypothetical protein